MSKIWIAGVTGGVVLAGLFLFGTLLDRAAPEDAASSESSAAMADSTTAATISTPEKKSSDVLKRIAPHKALYKIEMVEKRSGTQILNISGEMYFEWKPSCVAWTTDHRFSLLYEYAETPPMRITSDFTTYERFDGESFNFNSRRRRDGELYEELRGYATADSKNPGRAVFNMPAGLEYDLSPGTYFPMGHTVAILSAAEKNETFFSAAIFDGSDTEGPTEVNAFIGKPVNAMARMTPNTAINTDLVNTPARVVRLAFFPMKNEESDADYEMDVVLHENGVISDMHVEYKDFSVVQRLVALEKLGVEECAPASGPRRD